MRKKAKMSAIKRFFAVMYVLAAVAGWFYLSSQVTKADEAKREYYFVKIEKGDSLWSIAERELTTQDPDAATGSAIRRYVKQVQKMNKIQCPEDIRPGGTLIVYKKK